MHNNKSHTRQQWLTPAEVAARFHVSPITVRNWANAGKLKADVTPGGHRRFSVQSVEEFAASHQTGHNGKPESVLKVLIVDDDAEVAELLATLIRLHIPQAEYLFASDGFDAGFATKTHKPNIIFMDIRMPGMTGGSACELIKKDPDTAHIPVIGMTGFASSAENDKMLSAGALCVLKKPFDLDQLYPAIDSAIRSN